MAGASKTSHRDWASHLARLTVNFQNCFIIIETVHDMFCRKIEKTKKKSHPTIQ